MFREVCWLFGGPDYDTSFGRAIMVIAARSMQGTNKE